jgi:hypothetical protein
MLPGKARNQVDIFRDQNVDQIIPANRFVLAAAIPLQN